MSEYRTPVHIRLLEKYDIIPLRKKLVAFDVSAGNFKDSGNRYEYIISEEDAAFLKLNSPYAIVREHKVEDEL